MFSTDDSRSWSAIVHSAPGSPVRFTSRRHVATRARDPNSARTSTISRKPLPGSVPASASRSRSCTTARFDPGASSEPMKSRARLRSADAASDAMWAGRSPVCTMRSILGISRGTPSTSWACGVAPPQSVSARIAIAARAFMLVGEPETLTLHLLSKGSPYTLSRSPPQVCRATPFRIAVRSLPVRPF